MGELAMQHAGCLVRYGRSDRRSLCASDLSRLERQEVGSDSFDAGRTLSVHVQAKPEHSLKRLPALGVDDDVPDGQHSGGWVSVQGAAVAEGAAS